MKTFKEYIIENLDSFVDDKRYFDIAWRTLEDKSQEEDLLLYPMMGDEEFDATQHMFQDETEVRNEIYEKLDDIAKGIKSNMKNGKVRIYRGLSAKDMQKRVFEGNLKWESWSLDENIARNFSGYNSSSNKTNNTNSWLLIGLVELKDIDFDLIVDRWINFPEEYEIPVKNPMNIEIEEIWNLTEDKVYRKIKTDAKQNVIKYDESLIK